MRPTNATTTKNRTIATYTGLTFIGVVLCQAFGRTLCSGRGLVRLSPLAAKSPGEENDGHDAGRDKSNEQRIGVHGLLALPALCGSDYVPEHVQVPL